MRNPRAAKLLSMGCNPNDGCKLATAPRRLTNADVGYHGRQSEREASITGDELNPPQLHTVDNESRHNSIVHRAVFVDEECEENPFGFDGGLDS